jgi:hypothetical protein
MFKTQFTHFTYLVRIIAGLVLLCTANRVQSIDATPWTPPATTNRFVVSEVIGRPGHDNSTNSFDFSLSKKLPAGQYPLWLEVHGLHYENMMSIKVGDGESELFVSLNNTNCVFEGLGAKLGGMGGPLDTLTFHVPTVTVRPGRQKITLKFNQSDGNSIGFRVLDMNALDPKGKPVMGPSTKRLPEAAFSVSTNRADILNGSNLWFNAQLLGSWSGPRINAKCWDCHTDTGSDLKYFSYSKRSISERSQFHGLTKSQGNKIAAYIHSLPEERSGYPWDPPYQPGPGVDAKSASLFAAGSGLKWVLPKDSDSWGYLFPNGTNEAVSLSYTNTLNIRELPISMPLPDWNSWLPRIHPKDSYGASFQPVYDRLQLIRQEPSAAWGLHRFNEWHMALVDWYLGPLQTEASLAGYRDNSTHANQAWWSLGRWRAVKSWDVMKAKNWEASGQEFFSWPVNARSWPTHTAFLAAPHMLNLPQTGHFLRNGSQQVWEIGTHQWYWLQMVLNDSNHRRQGTFPIDWSYLVAFTHGQEKYGIGSAAQLTAALMKAGEATTHAPTDQWDGFNGLAGPALEFLWTREEPQMWDGYSPAFRDSVIRAHLAEFDRMARLVTRDHFITVTGEILGGETENNPGPPRGRPWVSSHSAMLVFLKEKGVASDIVETMRNLGEYLWPESDWARF